MLIYAWQNLWTNPYVSISEFNCTGGSNLYQIDIYFGYFENKNISQWKWTNFIIFLNTSHIPLYIQQQKNAGKTLTWCEKKLKMVKNLSFRDWKVENENTNWKICTFRV